MAIFESKMRVEAKKTRKNTSKKLKNTLKKCKNSHKKAQKDAKKTQKNALFYNHRLPPSRFALRYASQNETRGLRKASQINTGFLM
jgi:hypothetical protein